MPNVWMWELLTPAASHICDRKQGKADEKVFLVLQPLLQNRDRKGVSVSGTVWGTFIDASSSSEKAEQQPLKKPKLSAILSISELASYRCCCSGRRTAPHNHHDMSMSFKSDSFSLHNSHSVWEYSCPISSLIFFSSPWALPKETTYGTQRC